MKTCEDEPSDDKKEIFDLCELILENICEIHQNIKVITENEEG